MNMVQHGAEAVTRVVDRFEAKDIGAPFEVVLHGSVTVSFDKNTGEAVSYKIPNLDGLLRAIVITRVLHSRRLHGQEVKFLRKVISLKQKELASKIDVTVEHLSRCETGVLVMSPGSEKLLRIFVLKTAMKLHKMKSCKEKLELEEALDKLFDDLKPVSVFDAANKLVLNFRRLRLDEDEVGGESDRWDGDGLDQAA